MIIFGGKNDENQKLDDLWYYNVPTNKWTKHTVQLGDTVPIARSGHSAVQKSDSAGNHQMVVFGGIHEVTQELNDIYVFDLVAKKWHLQQSEREQEDVSPAKTALTVGTGNSPYQRKKSLRTPYYMTKSSLMDSSSKAKTNTLTIQVNPSVDKKKGSEQVELKSPASVEMKNSFIIKNSDPSFDTYSTAMRRKKQNMAYTNMGG
jgi:hypothetical protein